MPALKLVVLAVQVGAVPLHDSVPTLHGLAGVQASPVRQAAHWPAWHTWPVPQEAPFGTLSVSVQTGSPVPHPTVPMRQAFAVIAQLLPSLQVMHLPSRQVESSPHAVPLSRSMPVSRHEATSPAQTVSPW